MSSFDQKAKEWDKEKRRIQTAKKVAEAIKSCIPQKKYSILDLGCGTGLVSFELLDIARYILGIDTSSKMVEEFKKKTSSSTIQAKKCSIEEIEEKFDLIVSSMTFHHIEDLEHISRQIERHLNEQGIVCIADLESEDGTFHSDLAGVHHFGFDPDSLETLFAKKGFETICKKRVHTIMKHQPFYIFLLCMQKRA